MKKSVLPLFPQAPVVGIVGLGYVGLPLAVEFARQVKTVGFDISRQRVDELKKGLDKTGEVPLSTLTNIQGLELSADPSVLSVCNVFIVTVPTPINDDKSPNLSALRQASELIGKCLSPSNVVIYESTVYPGVTEDFCVPILEACSSLSLNNGFYVGYSPERINPGDSERGLADIIKITSGSTPEAADYVNELYSRIIKAGTHKAPGIKVAEAAKVIENVQRDLNIGLINELALIFDKLDIDTLDVLEAAGTKWNFLPFRPGLVGGHCISVDPYYLTHKASESGYHPDVILSGRKINDGMGGYVADKVVKLMVKAKINVANASVLVLGATFKENCPDLRNTRVVDIVQQLKAWGLCVDLYDPIADREGVVDSMSFVDNFFSHRPSTRYDAVVLAVAHDEFVSFDLGELAALCCDVSVVYDVKSVWPKHWVTARL